jgi:molecular chaperone GrpE
LIPVERKSVRDDSDSENQVETPVEASQNAEDDCRQLLSKREDELREAQDRILRLAAELDNTRKRLEREKSEGISYANESMMRQLVEVVDNLERAIGHGEQDTNCEGLLEGLRMTHKSFIDVLARFGAAPFESVGQSFDPNRHEAVFQEHNPDFPDMTVTRELQKGYTLRDRLLRPARVGVARNSKNDKC